MADVKIPKRISTALLNSLGAGVVPRVGLEYIAVGRKDEIAALLGDLDNIAEGGAAFRFVVGRYGSGKSFLLQLMRNHAMERDFVVADADLSPERRLGGTNGQAVATYRELMRNLSTKTRPDGGALAVILERWISSVQMQVIQEKGLRPDDPGLCDAVEKRILEVVGGMEGMVHGFDFAAVLSAYWRGNRLGEDNLKDAALRWFRGEFTTKTDAKAALGVRVIVDDDTWYDYLKLFASFVSSIGYKGLIIVIDEAVNLYKINHPTARQSNYEKVLSMFNDTMQGKAGNLGILVGGTPQFVEDPRRGLYSYEALQSRLAASRFAGQGLRDTSGPVLKLQTLTPEEVYVLLTRLAEVHVAHYGCQSRFDSEDLKVFLQVVLNRLGADELLTPRETVRDFLAVLNLLLQNPQVSFRQVIGSPDFTPTKAGKDPDVEEGGDFAEFKL